MPTRKKVTIEEARKAGGKKYKEKIKRVISKFDELPDEKKHQVHIYYGYGKGKTTAAMGIVFRMLGAGKSAAVVQFDKGHDRENDHYKEIALLKKLQESGYPVEIYTTGCERMNKDGTFRFKNAEEDFEEAKRALGISRRLITESKQNLLVLDEILAASAYHLITEKDVLDVLDLYYRNRRFELVITGHKLFPGLEEKAGLITEMRKVKHYFDEGIQAREGIEF